MGCCLSKKKPSSIPLSSGTSGDVKSPDPVKPNVEKPIKPVIELPVKPVIELPENPEAKPTISEKEEENDDSDKRRHERWKKTESDSASRSVVRTSSFTKEEVDAILIQCGKLSRSNSAAKNRRHSGSKRSFDLEEEREEEAGRRKTPQRTRGVERVTSSPRERRRRTPSRERESYRSGSRERERGGGSRAVSRSPGKRNPSGSLVNSSNIKFVTVPATDKNGGDPSSKHRVTTTVKRSIAMSDVQPPPSSLSRSSSRKAEQSPYRRRNPLGEIDQNATKGGDKRENEAAKAMMSRSHPSLRKSRDFDTSEEDNKITTTMSSYTALLLKDIKNFHGGKKSSDDEEEEEDPLCHLLPSCVTKACSIVEAVEDLNSTTDLNLFRFTSTVKKADLMEPSLEKYVTVKRGGGCCSSLEEQESCGSNNIT